MVINIGRKQAIANPYRISLKGKTHIVNDPRPLILSLLGMGSTDLRKNEHPYFPKHYWKLRTFYLMGMPESGKSVLLDYASFLLEELYGKENVQVFSTKNLYHAMWNAPIKKKVILMYVDDAVGVMSGRDSQKRAQKKASADYLEVRHILGEYRTDTPRNGVIFMMFASQTPTGVDIRIRENYHMLFLKSPNYPSLNKKFSSEMIEFLDEINHKSFIINDDNYKGYFIARTCSNREFKFYIPYIKYPRVQVVNPDSIYLEEVRTALIDKFDLENTPVGVLKGFMFIWCRKNEVEIAPSEMTQIINEANYLQHTGNHKPTSNDKINFKKLDEIHVLMRKTNLKINSFVDLYGKSQRTLYRHNEKYLQILANKNQEGGDNHNTN
jgi:hypothetical protein